LNSVFLTSPDTTKTLSLLSTFRLPCASIFPLGLFLCLSGATAQEGLLPNYVSTDELVGYWPLNWNAVDMSSNEFNGVVSGAIAAEDRFGAANGTFSMGRNALISILYTEFCFFQKTKISQIPCLSNLMPYIQQTLLYPSGTMLPGILSGDSVLTSKKLALVLLIRAAHGPTSPHRQLMSSRMNGITFLAYITTTLKRCMSMDSSSALGIMSSKAQQVMGHSHMTVSLGYLRNIELPTLTMRDIPVLSHGWGHWYDRKYFAVSKLH